MEPLTGYPNDVLPRLKRKVESMTNDSDIKKFYIGRSIDPCNRQDSDDTFPIYCTDSIAYAINVEDELIKHFYSHKKCINGAMHGGGGVSECFRNCVYIAVWKK